ncbi:response regulator [bacterium]|nr:response regulator [bacterium]
MAKILLVEDDISLREVYTARLQAENFQISVASNGEEALATAVKEMPDLVILDVMMPRISGFDVLDILRSTPETAKVKVIMMTALSAPEDKERGEKLGVNEYLVKSQVTLEDVIATVKKVLGLAAGPAAPAPTAAPAPQSQPPAQTPPPATPTA